MARMGLAWTRLSATLKGGLSSSTLAERTQASAADLIIASALAAHHRAVLSGERNDPQSSHPQLSRLSRGHQLPFMQPDCDDMCLFLRQLPELWRIVLQGQLERCRLLRGES